MTVLHPHTVMAQIPIVDDITHTATAVPSGAAGWGFDSMAEGIARGSLGALSFLVV